MSETGKFEKQLHDTEIGQRVSVVREEAKGKLIEDAAETLKSIGRAIQTNDDGAKALRYVGSAAVHIYVSELLTDEKGKQRAMFFTQVSTLGNTNEMIASDACIQLAKDAAAKHYGRQMAVKRSGF
jgi:hypothetical protein